MLSGIPTYFLSLLRVPSSMSKSLENLRRNFLREGINEGNGLNLMHLEVVSRLLDPGG